MARACTICAHPQRPAIDRALVARESFRSIAQRTGTSATALRRHKEHHLGEVLARAQSRSQRAEISHTASLVHQAATQEAAADASAIDTMAQLGRCFANVNRLFDACDRWLRDPEHPDQYDIGPRADDVVVTYSEPDGNGNQGRKRARLSELLAKVTTNGRSIDRAEYRHADPRELLLKTSAQLQGHLELLAKLMEMSDYGRRLKEIEDYITQQQGGKQPWVA